MGTPYLHNVFNEKAVAVGNVRGTVLTDDLYVSRAVYDHTIRLLRWCQFHKNAINLEISTEGLDLEHIFAVIEPFITLR